MENGVAVCHQKEHDVEPHVETRVLYSSDSVCHVCDVLKNESGEKFKLRESPENLKLLGRNSEVESPCQDGLRNVSGAESFQPSISKVLSPPLCSRHGPQQPDEDSAAAGDRGLCRGSPAQLDQGTAGGTSGRAESPGSRDFYSFREGRGEGHQSVQDKTSAARPDEGQGTAVEQIGHHAGSQEAVVRAWDEGGDSEAHRLHGFRETRGPPVPRDGDGLPLLHEVVRDDDKAKWCVTTMEEEPECH